MHAGSDDPPTFPQPGHFTPEDAIWQVIRHSALVLGGGRALLMQAAHPRALAGFIEHSDYTVDPAKRLRRTLETVWTGVYGTPEEAEAAGRRVRAIHARVRGVTPRDFGPVPAGTPYAADDPELLLWVHSTLVDTSLVAYRTFVGPLDGERAEAFYRDMGGMAVLFGTPPEVIPPTLADFDDYMRGMLEGELLCVPDEAREIASVVTAPELARPLRTAWPVVNGLTAALLPPRLREAYGLRWSAARERAFRSFARLVRSGAIVLPDRATALPMARAAERRLARP